MREFLEQQIYLAGEKIKEIFSQTYTIIFLSITLVWLVYCLVYYFKNKNGGGKGPTGSGISTGKKRLLPKWLRERNEKFVAQTS